MRLCFTLLLVSVCALSSRSQNLLSIDSLVNGANELVVYDHTDFLIKSATDTRIKRSYKVLILNQYADDKNQITLWYNDFIKVDNVSVLLADANGNKIEKYNIKDFGDFSTKGYSLADDSRAKHLSITHRKYPYILEVEYEIHYSTSFFYPSWRPQNDEKISVASADFHVKNLSNTPLRFKNINVKEDSIVDSDEGRDYYWSISNRPSIDMEPYSRKEDAMPQVRLAPSTFEIDGVTGNMESWKDFGLWSYELIKDRNTLSPEQLYEFHQSLNTAESKEDSIRAAYKYVQQNTRYVSIQLGIGGWQPFESGFVHTQKYGDCKALSYYTKCLLESIGIESYYTLINAGRNPTTLYRDFPDNYFNHAIITVPMGSDTVWLECTSQTNPYGNLGTWIGDRDALMITSKGGELIHTKKYKSTENTQSTFAEIALKSDGKGSMTLNRAYKGMEIENDGFQWALLDPKSKQEEWFVDKHNWGTLSLKSLELTPLTEEEVPEGMVHAEVELVNAYRKTGDRIFFSPFKFNDISYIRLKDTERKHPLHIRYPYTHIDSIKVILPNYLSIERGLKEEEITTKYGNYKSKFVQTGTECFFIREFTLQDGTYAPSEYQEFRDFIKSVQKIDGSTVVFLDRT